MFQNLDLISSEFGLYKTKILVIYFETETFNFDIQTIF